MAHMSSATRLRFIFSLATRITAIIIILVVVIVISYMCSKPSIIDAHLVRAVLGSPCS